MTDPDPNSPAEGERKEGFPIRLEVSGRATTSSDDALTPAATTADSLSVPPDYAPRRRPDVLELDMGDGAILYDDDTSLVHHLNPSATLIWHLCDGSGSAEELARDIAEEYGLDRRTVTGQVMAVIGELDALGLVEDGRGGQAGGDELRHGS